MFCWPCAGDVDFYHRADHDLAAQNCSRLQFRQRTNAVSSGGLWLTFQRIALVFSGSAVMSTSNVPEHQAGLAGGVMNTAMELGPTIGLAVFMSVAGLRTDIVEGYALAFAAGTGIYLLVATWLMFLPERTG